MNREVYDCCGKLTTKSLQCPYCDNKDQGWKPMNELKLMTISIGIDLCGSIEKLHEVMVMGQNHTIQGGYWIGIYDALKRINDYNNETDRQRES